MEATVEENLQCSICMDIYDDPRCLSCLHTFCFKCLKDYCKGKTAGQTVNCPECREEYQLTEKGVEGFKRNFFASRIVETISKTRPTETCESCRREMGQSTMFCADCSLKLCLSCSTAHTNIPMLRQHKVVDTKSKTVDELFQMIKTRSSFCELHQADEVTLYCLQCNTAICMKCFALKHTGHQCEDIDDTAHRGREEIRQRIASIDEFYKKHDVQVKKITDERDKKLSEIDSVRNDIKRFYKTVQDRLGHDLNELVGSLDGYDNRIRKLVDGDLNELDLSKSVMDSFNTFSSALLQSGTSSEIARFIDQIRERASMIQTSKTSLPDEMNLDITFTGSLISQQLLDQKENTIGKIECKKATKEINYLETPGKLGILAPSPLAPVLKNMCVIGLAVMDEEIFIIRVWSTLVECYDLTSLALSHVAEVSNLNDPTDMSCSLSTKTLYITGQKDKAIFKLHNDGSTSFWRLDDVPFRLSVAENTNVIVTFRLALRLKEYTADGQLLRTIHLPGTMKPPRNALRVGKHFVVCHGELGEQQHRVCFVSETGKIEKAYGNKEGSAEREINVPVHLIQEPTGGYLVADLNNHRIHLLDAELNFRKHLLTAADGINVPRKLFFTEDSLLCVGQDKGEVVLYQVS